MTNGQVEGFSTSGTGPGRYISPPAPPTEVGYAETPPKQSSWPTIIGVIAIVLGAGGALIGCFGALSPFFLDAMMSAMPPQAGQQAIQDVAKDWMAWTIPIALVSVVLALLLLIGGIGLLKRRPWASKTCVAWAIIRILLVAVNSGVGYVIQQKTWDIMSQQDPNLSALPAGFTGGILAATVVFNLLWGWALPVFMLIWFSRRKIKDEVVGWGAPVAAGDASVRCTNPQCQALNRAGADYCAYCGTTLPR